MSVGAVVVSHDSARDLSACLGALGRARSLAAVVVVDNASSDGSAARAREAHEPVTVLELGTNVGFAGGCNRGLAALPAEVGVVAFLNPDVEVDPACLERCAARLDDDPALAGVAPRLMRPDGRTVDSVGQVLARATLEVRDLGYGRELDAELLRPREVLAPCGALAVYRRNALDQVVDQGGPWAEHYFCFWEDLELGWRLVNRGWRHVSLPDAVAVHGRGAGAAPGRGPLRWRRPPLLEACVVSNRWMTLIRHLHPRDLARRLPVLAAWDAAVLSASALRRPSLLRHLARRWPLVLREWRGRGRAPRRRLNQLPW